MKGLHITDALGLLAYFFCGYAALLVMWTVWKKERPKHAERWMKFLLTARTKKDKFDDGMARWWPLAAAICWFIGAGAIFYQYDVAETLYGIDGSGGPYQWPW